MNHLRQLSKYFLVVSVAVFLLYMIVAFPRFYSQQNLFNLMNQFSYVYIYALAQYYVLIAKSLDLSQGGVIAIVAVTVALLSTSLGVPGAFFVGVLLALGIGFLTGIIISRFDVSPFVVTLGVGYLCTGVALLLSGGIAVYNVPDGFNLIGWMEIGGIPLIFLFLVVISVLHFAVIRFTKYGIYLFAVGSNEQAAEFSGIPTKRVKTIAFVISFLLVGIGAIFAASRLSSGHPVEGADTALISVAACVIGGVSLFGGRGTLQGVILGAILLTVLSNALNLLNVSSYVQQVLVGIIIILAVLLDKARTYEK